MTINEIPFDCFTTHCCVSGTCEEIDQAFKEYVAKYPYLQYATRIKERTDNSAIFVRWTRREDCIAACIHTPRPDPISSDVEEGKDHTIFQTY
tara:strand:+ start:3037 stop:3315 length:279 start_codon:yes stop_codon:yes gene_type:complete